MLQIFLGLQLQGRLLWVGMCWAQMVLGMASTGQQRELQIQAWALLQGSEIWTERSLGWGSFLDKIHWNFSSELTLILVAALSCAISQLNFSLKFQIGRGRKWLSKSCRTYFFPSVSSALFYIFWFYRTKRTTLAKSDRFFFVFDSFYLDVDMWFLYS